MKKLAVFIFSILAVSGFAQVKPNQFLEETNPSNANFEFYSQKNLAYRRASFINVRKGMLPVAQLTAINYIPLSTGNTSNLGEIVADSTGAVWYIDGSGNAIGLTGSTNGPIYVTADTSAQITVYAPSHGLADTILLYGYVPVQAGFTRANSTSADSVFIAYAIDAPSADSLTLVFSGVLVYGSWHGKAINVQYYLQDDGSEDITPGTVSMPTAIASDSTTLFLREVGVDIAGRLRRIAMPSPLITAFGGNPASPTDAVVQAAIEGAYLPAGLAQPGTIFTLSYATQSYNPTYQQTAPNTNPLTPSYAWLWDGAYATRIVNIPTSVNLQDVSYGVLGTLVLLPIDSLMAASVPTDTEVALWLDTNYTANNLRLANGSLLYFIGDSTRQNPEYIWQVIDDISYDAGDTDWEKILKKLKFPGASEPDSSMYATVYALADTAAAIRGDMTSGGNSVKLPNASPYKVGEWWLPGSLSDSYGNSVDWGDTSAAIFTSDLRAERPSLAFNSDRGRLLLTYRWSEQHLYYQPAVLLSKYSDDFGATWSAVDTIFDDGAAGADPINSVCTWDRKTGKYFLAYEAATNAALPNPDTDIRFLTSVDGLTWTPIDTITKAQMIAQGYCGMGIIGDFVRANDGKLLLPIYTRFAADCTTGARAVHAAISDDDGASWTYSLIDSAASRDLNEPVLFNGLDSLYAFVRSEDNQLWRYGSADNGITWSAGTDVTPPGYIRSKPDFTLLSGNRLIIVYRDNATTFNPNYAISTDWGENWTDGGDLPDLDGTHGRWYYGDWENIAPNLSLYAVSLANSASTGTAKIYFRQVVGGAVTINGETKGLILAKEETAASTIAVDLRNRIRKVTRVDVSSLSNSVEITTSNPLDAGQYVFYFNNDADTLWYNFPLAFKQFNGDTFGIRTADDLRVECDYLESQSAYFCQLETLADYDSPPPFTPLDVDSLYWMFEADTLVTDSLGGAIANNEGVGGWGDLSGNGRDLIQSTNGARPVWKATNGIGGGPCLQFDGSNDFIAEGTASWWGADSLTIIIVGLFSDTVSSPSEILVSKYDATGNNRQWQIGGGSVGGSNNIIRFTVSSAGTAATTIDYTTTNAWTTYQTAIIRSQPGAAPVLEIDGANQTTATSSTALYDNSVAKFAIGANAVTSTPASFLNGKIVAVYVFARYLTNDEVTNMKNYINARF